MANYESSTLEDCARLLRLRGANLRKKAYPAEVAFRDCLTDSAWLWNEPLHGYIPDFYHPAAKLIVEIDGSSHRGAIREGGDKRRDAFFAQLGIHTLRLSNGDVFRDPAGQVKRVASIVAFRKQRLSR